MPRWCIHTQWSQRSIPSSWIYHLFDGDGMVHCVRISKGRATLCSRYVKTYKYNTEREAGFPIVPSCFSSFNGLSSSALYSVLYTARIPTRQYNPAKGIGLTNTSLALIGNHLFALGESDLPYAVRLTSSGDIETLCRHDFDGKLFRSMTAHPKVDPDTGETFAFRYGNIRRPFPTYFYFDANGNKQPDVPLWFNPIHVINAWDEDYGNAIFMIAPNILSVEHILDRMDLVQALVEKVRIDLKTDSNKASTRNLDFAVINPAYVAKRNKYVYAALGDPMPKISGVVKLDVSKGDLKECTVGSRMYGAAWCYGGEPFFVAKEPGNPEAEEDDGYVLSFVHNEKTGESRLLVMDAKSADLDVLAEVKLPQRLPYGFHGLFYDKR
ncbi:hypothetical protein CRYUN_Cryun12cG0004300 [Craigia yunnanensis]